jgi:hypothetical protein
MNKKNSYSSSIDIGSRVFILLLYPNHKFALQDSFRLNGFDGNAFIMAF